VVDLEADFGGEEGEESECFWWWHGGCGNAENKKGWFEEVVVRSLQFEELWWCLCV
jgi:hypothetical protein